MSHFVTPRSVRSPVKLAFLVLGSLAGTLSLGAATAADNPPSIVVKYGDLDLSTSAGVNEVYRRLVRAAKQVCPDMSFQDLSLQRKIAECRDQAVARAIRQIDNSQLAALYASHSKNG